MTNCLFFEDCINKDRNCRYCTRNSDSPIGDYYQYNTFRGVKQFFKKKLKIKTQTRKVTNSQEDIIVTVIDTETKEEVCRLIVKKINSIYKICLENHVEDQKLFNEIMDEAERLNPQPELTGCPCNTCIYDGEVCELENLEPHTSRLLQICYDYDEGEEENEY